MPKSPRKKNKSALPGALPPEQAFASGRELIVIASPDLGLRARGESVASVTGSDINPLSDLLASEGIRLRPLFGTSEERVQAQVASAAEETDAELPDLSVFYRVEAPDERLEDLAASLRQMDGIEAAYVKPPAEPAQVVLNDMTPIAEDAPPVSPDFTPRQLYLDPAPGGIDARYAWTRTGGRGQGVRIIDVEGAWNFSHEDLLQNQGGVIGGTQSTSLDWRNHGTAVVGVFSADDNGFGVTGICSDANVRAISIFGGTGSAGAIRQAADALSAGDIILIELHRPGPRFNFQQRMDQLGYIAVEWWPDDFAAVQYATGRGVIVVEAGGNGAQDLDDALYSARPNTTPVIFPVTWTNPFNRANRDSGAIVVGAGAPPPNTHGRNYGNDRSRLGFSNFGALIDAQGWGREVTTCGYGDLQGGTDENLWYTDTFSGTSSASPVIVGTLGCLQGVLRAQNRPLLTPATARNILRSTGSPQQDEPGRPATQRIGNRPDLRQAIAQLTVAGWNHNDLSAAAGAPIAVGDPAGYTWDVDRTQHVVYRGNDSHIHELWFNGQWNHNDLSVAAAAPSAASDPAGYTWDIDRTQHVVYRGIDNHIHELWFNGQWNHNDLTIAACAPHAIGNPAGYTWDIDHTQHVVHQSTDCHIHELWFNGQWHHNDLTVAAGAPDTAGDPAGYTWDVDSTQHVVYRGNDNHIHELWFNGQWNHNDLTNAAGGPGVLGNPAGYTWDIDHTQHVVHRSGDSHIHELWFNGQWNHNDLSLATGAPDTAGDPAGYTWDVDSTQHVVYRGTDSHIHELWFSL